MKLLFIHKPGRDRYDLKGGCRPIVCLSHLLSNDERLVAAIVTRHVDTHTHTPLVCVCVCMFLY